MADGPSSANQSRLVSIDTISPVSHEDITLPDLATCFNQWSELCDGKFAPDIKSSDLLDFPLHCIPSCSIIDVSRDYTDFSYRFWGSNLTRLARRDMTGKSVREMPVSDEGIRFYEQFNLILETRKPALFKIKFRFMDDQYSMETILRLPLSSDNDTIDHILSFHDLGQNELLSDGDIFHSVIY